MKSTFQINSFIAPALIALGVDLPKLVNAVQASLGSARLVDEEVKRGNVKLVKDDEGTKGGDFTFTEGETNKYRGKTDAPARFGKWHDALATFFKKHGAPHDELTAEIIPNDQLVWLTDKMLVKPEVPAPATPPENQGNGKGRNGKGRNGKGEVKPNIPAPAAPAA